MVVLEKRPGVAAHQTGHNSGVVHASVYYAPGSLKARLCRRDLELLRTYCKERSLPYEERGKVIVARNRAEVDKLSELHRRAQANGVPGIRRLGAAELREIEPHAVGVAALHSPTTAITDFRAVTEALARDVTRAGGTVSLGVQVTRLQASGRTAQIHTIDDVMEFDRVIVCAGRHGLAGRRRAHRRAGVCVVASAATRPRRDRRRCRSTGSVMTQCRRPAVAPKPARRRRLSSSGRNNSGTQQPDA